MTLEAVCLSGKLILFIHSGHVYSHVRVEMLRGIEHIDDEYAIGIGVNAWLSLRHDRWEINLADSADGVATRNEGNHFRGRESLECKVCGMRS